jgi:uncharacterized protein
VHFEWDEKKNQTNIRKHGIDFQDAVDIFNHPVLTWADSREAYGEERWIALGWMKELIAVVVYVERYEDVVRIISARKAARHEARRYEQEIGN